MSTGRRRRRRPKRWSFTAGERGRTVTVEERRPGGMIYARAFDPSAAGGRGGYRRLSLNHDDRDRAMSYALEEAKKLREGQSEMLGGRTTLARLFALYLAHRTPRKSLGSQCEDRRRVALWTRVLGGGKDPHLVTLAEWEAFVDARSSGAINAHGEGMETDKRQPVRDRTVGYDCGWLLWVFNWGTKWRDPNTGRYLMRENTVRGYPIPKEKNPLRPIVTQDRFEKVRAVADGVTTFVGRGQKRREVKSYLPEILDIANGTGRRIRAILQLRYDDLRLDVKPYGAIRWPAATDKKRKEWVVPISPSVRAAIDRIMAARPGIGAAYLFPSFEDPSCPVRYELARTWLAKAEELAGVPKQKNGAFHPYRRKWATERKHLPDVDVAAAGGWSDTFSLKHSYQQADDATMLEVVLGGGELRERQA